MGVFGRGLQGDGLIPLLDGLAQIPFVLQEDGISQVPEPIPGAKVQDLLEVGPGAGSGFGRVIVGFGIPSTI